MTATDSKTPVLKIAVLAMGGQGGGVLCNWIVQTAERCNYFAQSTSVPGVAQRTGATVYYIEVAPRPAEAGKKPLLALMPVPGHIDMVVAGELIESGRAILRGLVSPHRTTSIVSTHRDYAVGEKSAMGDGRIDSDKLLAACEKHSKRFIGFNMAELAEKNDSVISSVLFGAIAGSGLLPFDKSAFEAVISASGIAVETNLKGFEAGYLHAQQTHPEVIVETTEEKKGSSSNPALQVVLDRIAGYPQQIRTHALAALQKLIDYQDLDYAVEYLDKLEKIIALDNAEKDYQLSNETARYLALWMSYEDTIRVADLKTRSSRFARVRRETLVGKDQALHIEEYMHPRIEEICDTMPAAIGRWCLQNRQFRTLLAVFCKQGKRINTTKLTGFLLLYTIAGLRPFRRRTLRYHNEMSLITNWLTSIAELATGNYALALEVCMCQDLVKGYGDTHTRGMTSFNTIMQTLSEIRNEDQAAAKISALREAALADDSGEALQQTLKKTA